MSMGQLWASDNGAFEVGALRPRWEVPAHREAALILKTVAA